MNQDTEPTSFKIQRLERAIETLEHQAQSLEQSGNPELLAMARYRRAKIKSHREYIDYIKASNRQT